MALHINNLEELKQIFKEQEENEQRHQKEQAEAEQIKKDNYIYIVSILTSFGAILTSFISFLAILFKF